MFWGWAVAIAFTTAIAVLWPLLKQHGRLRSYAVAMAIFVPLLTLFIYQQIGTPEGISIDGRPGTEAQSSQAASVDDQIESLIVQLEQRLEQAPDDFEGWMLLGRTYKTIQQYQPAKEALSHALDIAPDNPLVMVELAEARLFTSGGQSITSDITDMLEKALEIDPLQQKGLWLLGFASTQKGDDARAIELWGILLTQMDPSVEARIEVQSQIDLAKSRMGIEPAAKWQGLDIQVDMKDLQYQVPQGAVLFIIARNPFVPGPPLGVRRIQNPVFPVSITMTDSDAMIPASPVSAVENIQLLARLSLSGNPTAGENDPESAVVTVNPEIEELTALVLEVPPSP
ncbi:MAG: cytochrome c-type biogenesis protein CcmH [Lysobacterales bacterium]|jgi:cytochrome c-type biogenesis protein CcmH